NHHQSGDGSGAVQPAEEVKGSNIRKAFLIITPFYYQEGLHLSVYLYLPLSGLVLICLFNQLHK
nr:hypothetical protein [Bacillota bacterium]